jgi:hypothetical protein
MFFQAHSLRFWVSVHSLVAAVGVACGLQVRSDCPPRQLVEFLVSDTGVMADQVRRVAVHDDDVTDGQLLHMPACDCDPV